MVAQLLAHQKGVVLDKAPQMYLKALLAEVKIEVVVYKGDDVCI